MAGSGSVRHSQRHRDLGSLNAHRHGYNFFNNKCMPVMQYETWKHFSFFFSNARPWPTNVSYWASMYETRILIYLDKDSNPRDSLDFIAECIQWEYAKEYLFRVCSPTRAMSNFETCNICHTISCWFRWNCRDILVSVCVATLDPVLEMCSVSHDMNVLAIYTSTHEFIFLSLYIHVALIEQILWLTYEWRTCISKHPPPNAWKAYMYSKHALIGVVSKCCARNMQTLPSNSDRSDNASK